MKKLIIIVAAVVITSLSVNAQEPTKIRNLILQEEFKQADSAFKAQYKALDEKMEIAIVWEKIWRREHILAHLICFKYKSYRRYRKCMCTSLNLR